MTLTARATSGDPIADGRHAYAQACLDDGDPLAAADLARQTLERVPDWAPAWHLLGRALLAGGDRDGAAGAFREALRADPADGLGAGLDLAALGVPMVQAMSRAYVATLFDAYAPRFDAHLASLDYRAPELLAARLRPAGPFRRVLDLGCGTGLMGAAIRDVCAWLGGCDLSPDMVAAARRRGLYDHLAAVDLETALAAEDEGALDLVVAADVFVYVGALEPAFDGASRALAPGGLFAFTVQACPEEQGEYELGEDRRYAHAPAYLDRLAAGRFNALTMDQATLRRDRGRDVPGLVVVLRKA